MLGLLYECICTKKESPRRLGWLKMENSQVIEPCPICGSGAEIDANGL